MVILYQDGFESGVFDPTNWRRTDASFVNAPVHFGSLAADVKNGILSSEFNSLFSGLSFRIWFYDDITRSQNAIIQQSGVSGTNGVIYIYVNDLGYSTLIDNNGNPKNSITVPRSNGWHHAEIINNPSGIGVYIDGVLLDSDTSGFPWDQFNFTNNVVSTDFYIDDIQIDDVLGPEGGSGGGTDPTYGLPFDPVLIAVVGGAMIAGYFALK